MQHYNFIAKNLQMDPNSKSVFCFAIRKSVARQLELQQEHPTQRILIVPRKENFPISILGRKMKKRCYLA